MIKQRNRILPDNVGLGKSREATTYNIREIYEPKNGSFFVSTQVGRFITEQPTNNSLVKINKII